MEPADVSSCWRSTVATITHQTFSSKDSDYIRNLTCKGQSLSLEKKTFSTVLNLLFSGVWLRRTSTSSTSSLSSAGSPPHPHCFCNQLKPDSCVNQWCVCSPDLCLTSWLIGLVFYKSLFCKVWGWFCVYGLKYLAYCLFLEFKVFKIISSLWF